MKERTTEAVLGGRLLVEQPRRGYRFSVDALLLAAFFRPAGCRSLVDLGTGCGIIPLILAHRHPRLAITAIEIQPALAAIAAANVRRNGMEDRITVLSGDLRELAATGAGGPFDAAAANPPYRRASSGRINPDTERALARHEIALTLPELVRAAAALLRNGGRFATIYPAERLTELLGCMGGQRLEPKRLQAVHSRRSSPAKLILVEGVKGARPGIAISAPFILYSDSGEYTERAQEIFRP
jgi:tRNA1Val (adenine37-N6)-methyltransferase